MTPDPRVLAIGAVDERGVRGSSGVVARWSDHGARVPGAAKALRTLFGKRDDTIRRLDATSRALIFAAEAAGIDRVLSADERANAAFVVETRWGSLDADRRFARSLEQPMVNGAVFPYTLPSLCLGEVALRHGLHGPTHCLPVDDGEASALVEAHALFAGGDVEHAIVGSVDVLDDPLPGCERRCRVVVAVLAGGRGPAGVAPWPGTATDSFDALARVLD